MKKWLAMIICTASLMLITACGNSANENETNNAPNSSANTSVTATKDEQDTQKPDQDIPTDEDREIPKNDTEAANSQLIVYFSWSGNTESVANEIRAQSGADIFRITPIEAYTDDYNTLLDIAQNEQRDNARPEISGSIENFSDYDVIYLGFPNWWSDMPMIVYTFFDEYDLSGKTLAPFCTSGGSGFSDTLNTMASLEPNASMTEGLHIRDSGASDPCEEVSEWLEKIGLS